MSARVLVVDDIAANVRLLEAKLLIEYYEVISAHDGRTALDSVRANAPDIVLLDVMMPGIDGLEVCRAIKADPETAHIPVVMVTALSETRDRVRGLQAGADDFLTKPANDVIMMARIRSLVRLKRAADEWRTRESTFLQFGAAQPARQEDEFDQPGRILLVIENDSGGLIPTTLAAEGHEITTLTTVSDALARTVEAEPQLVIVDDWIDNEDGLRLCSQLRSVEHTRNLPILLVVSENDAPRLAKALEIGVNDYLVRPVTRDELVARTRSQIRRKRYEDSLRATYERSVAAALTDSLTGLYNRRYLDAHFQGLNRRLAATGKPMTLVMLDVDRFKAVNDLHGHGPGDEVLRVIANRILMNCRGFDTAVRLGGEEFVVFMPGAAHDAALAAAERLRQTIAGTPVEVREPALSLRVTVSAGVASARAGEIELDELLRRADAALYEAKRTGRNRVVCAETGLVVPTCA